MPPNSGAPIETEDAKAVIDWLNGGAKGYTTRTGDARRRARAIAAGVDLAVRCGAAPLAERVRTDLLIAGARPRRAGLSGVAALTTNERRVAAMAAAGSSNREIAQALYVSHKTVEKHLSAAYRKLGVGGRGDLTTALAKEWAPPARSRGARPSGRAPRGAARQLPTGAGSGRTMTVSAISMTSSAGRSARRACSRIASGLLPW